MKRAAPLCRRRADGCLRTCARGKLQIATSGTFSQKTQGEHTKEGFTHFICVQSHFAQRIPSSQQFDYCDFSKLIPLWAHGSQKVSKKLFKKFNFSKTFC